MIRGKELAKRKVENRACYYTQFVAYIVLKIWDFEDKNSKILGEDIEVIVAIVLEKKIKDSEDLYYLEIWLQKFHERGVQITKRHNLRNNWKN